MNDTPSRRHTALWLAIGTVAIIGILGNVAIAVWLLNRTV